MTVTHCGEWRPRPRRQNRLFVKKQWAIRNIGNLQGMLVRDPPFRLPGDWLVSSFAMTLASIAPFGDELCEVEVSWPKFHYYFDLEAQGWKELPIYERFPNPVPWVVPELN